MRPDGDPAVLDRAIGGVAAAGLNFVEIPLRDPGGFDVALTRRLLNRYGVGATCSVGLPEDAHAPVAPERAVAFLEKAVEVTAALGSEVLTGEVYTHLGTFTGRPPENTS
ncbi:MAG: sugar phosphate isomerase/epimerase [Actinomycetota bacterium]|nr:sugar phosphate isomerase/epimerase [Actinomycetota bacterium]